jgi:hypothetical protein
MWHSMLLHSTPRALPLHRLQYPPLRVPARMQRARARVLETAVLQVAAHDQAVLALAAVTVGAAIEVALRTVDDQHRPIL